MVLERRRRLVSLLAQAGAAARRISPSAGTLIVIVGSHIAKLTLLGQYMQSGFGTEVI
jgi:hypothetical protein